MGSELQETVYSLDFLSPPYKKLADRRGRRDAFLHRRFPRGLLKPQMYIQALMEPIKQIIARI